MRMLIPDLGGWQWVLMGVIVAGGALYILSLLKKALWFVLAAAGVGGALLTYQFGYITKARQVEAEIARVERARIATIDQLMAENERRAREDAAIIAQLRKQIDETPVNTRAALPRDAAGRVRNIH